MVMHFLACLGWFVGFLSHFTPNQIPNDSVVV